MSFWSFHNKICTYKKDVLTDAQDQKQEKLQEGFFFVHLKFNDSE